MSLVLNLVANGMTDDEIIEAYPYLEPEDIEECRRLADVASPGGSHHRLGPGP